MEFQADHSVAEVDQAGAGIALDFFLAGFKRGQQKNSGPLRNRMICGAGKIEIAWSAVA
jgi:hypothetical protein